jgi:hypothetical protein
MLWRYKVQSGFGESRLSSLLARRLSGCQRCLFWGRDYGSISSSRLEACCARGWWMDKIIASGHPFGTLNDVVSQYRLGISILSMSPGVIHVLVLQWRYKEMNMAGCYLNFSSRHVIIFCPPLTR